MPEEIQAGLPVRPANIFRAAWVIAAFSCSLVAVSEGAEFRVQPAILISEEYNDNIFLERENTTEEYITRVQPSIQLKYNAPLWEWDIGYVLQYRYYAERSRGDETVHDLNASTHVTVLRDFFFVDISDRFGRVSLDATRDFTRESLFVNQTDRNILTVNPYLLLKISPTASISTGYIYRDTWYEEEVAVDTESNIAYLEVEKETSDRLKLYVGYRHGNENSEARDFEKDDAYLGGRYEYAEESFLFAEAGNSWLDFEDGDSYSQVYWNAGLTHKVRSITGTLRSALEYDENPAGTPLKVNSYEASLNTKTERTDFLVSLILEEYRDIVTKNLLTRRYGVGGDIRYALTHRVTGVIEQAFDRFEIKLPDTEIDRYLSGVMLEYEIAQAMVVTLAYRYADADSRQSPEGDYSNNRVILEIKKSF